jgi:hypothetical protein
VVKVRPSRCARNRRAGERRLSLRALGADLKTCRRWEKRPPGSGEAVVSPRWGQHYFDRSPVALVAGLRRPWLCPAQENRSAWQRSSGLRDPRQSGLRAQGMHWRRVSRRGSPVLGLPHQLRPVPTCGDAHGEPETRTPLVERRRRAQAHRRSSASSKSIPSTSCECVSSWEGALREGAVSDDQRHPRCALTTALSSAWVVCSRAHELGGAKQRWCCRCRWNTNCAPDAVVA